MDIRTFLESKGLKNVAGRTYPMTFGIVSASSFLAEQVYNRDSASWKKAEYIVVEDVQPDNGRSLLSGWRKLVMADPDGAFNQKLFVAIGGGIYIRYGADGMVSAPGFLDELL